MGALDRPPIRPTREDYLEALRAINLTRWKQMHEYYKTVIELYEIQHPEECLRGW